MEHTPIFLPGIPAFAVTAAARQSAASPPALGDWPASWTGAARGHGDTMMAVFRP